MATDIRREFDYQALIKDVLTHQGILVAFIIFIIGFGLISERFLSPDNVMTVIRQASIVGCIALGVTVVVIGGNLDLSVGSLLSFSTVLVVDLHDKIGPAGAMLMMFFCTLAVGSLTGFLVGYLRLNSLIVTLGMLSAIQGITLIYTGGQNVDIVNQEDTWFAFFGRGSLFGITTPVLMFLILAVVLQIVLSKSTYGRQVFAVGGNSLLGGSGSVFKTVIGVLILGFIQNGLLLMGFPYYTQWLVTWVVIILAVWLDVASKRGTMFSKIA